MAWTSGFFNSVDDDRLYTADQISAMFDGLITDGVYESIGNKLAVQPNSGMTIQIGTGRGRFGGRWVYNDSPYLITLNSSDVTLNRYVAICVRADNNLRTAEPYVKYGDLATAPVKPSVTRSESHKEYCLGYVLIRAGATAITASDIEDSRANTSVCGWVTGLIKQVDTKTLWTQWEALFNDFMTAKQAQVESWYTGLKDYVDDDLEVKLADDMAAVKNRVLKATGTFDGLGWNSQGDGTYIQVVNVSGVTTYTDILISPQNAYTEAYHKMGCYVLAKGPNFITFKCDNPDDINMVVDVLIFDNTGIDTATNVNVANVNSYTVTDDGNGNVTIIR